MNLTWLKCLSNELSCRPILADGDGRPGQTTSKKETQEKEKSSQTQIKNNIVSHSSLYINYCFFFIYILNIVSNYKTTTSEDYNNKSIKQCFKLYAGYK